MMRPVRHLQTRIATSTAGHVPAVYKSLRHYDWGPQGLDHGDRDRTGQNFSRSGGSIRR